MHTRLPEGHVNVPLGRRCPSASRFKVVRPTRRLDL